jgi:hypothetical protein
LIHRHQERDANRVYRITEIRGTIAANTPKGTATPTMVQTLFVQSMLVSPSNVPAVLSWALAEVPKTRFRPRCPSYHRRATSDITTENPSVQLLTHRCQYMHTIRTCCMSRTPNCFKEKTRPTYLPKAGLIPPNLWSAYLPSGIPPKSTGGSSTEIRYTMNAIRDHLPSILRTSQHATTARPRPIPSNALAIKPTSRVPARSTLCVRRTSANAVEWHRTTRLVARHRSPGQ